MVDFDKLNGCKIHFTYVGKKVMDKNTKIPVEYYDLTGRIVDTTKSIVRVRISSKEILCLSKYSFIELHIYKLFRELTIDEIRQLNIKYCDLDKYALTQEIEITNIKEDK